MKIQHLLLSLVIAGFICFAIIGLHTVAGNLPPKEKQTVYTLPEKTNMPCMIYKVEGAFVIIINDEELSK